MGKIASVRSGAQASRNVSRPVVFRARGLSKTYGMGDIKVHALRDVDLQMSVRSEQTVGGRRRCSFLEHRLGLVRP